MLSPIRNELRASYAWDSVAEIRPVGARTGYYRTLDNSFKFRYKERPMERA